MWIAGGGFRGGYTHGATDDFASKSVQDGAAAYDLHATRLHALGLDHRGLVVQHDGRGTSLTHAGATGARSAPTLLA